MRGSSLWWNISQGFRSKKVVVVSAIGNGERIICGAGRRSCFQIRDKEDRQEKKEQKKTVVLLVLCVLSNLKLVDKAAINESPAKKLANIPDDTQPWASCI